MHDLVLKNGHVIDPGQSINRIADVAFANGKVAAIGDELGGRETVDCSGSIVSPGLIDLHTHVYWGGSALGVDPVAYARSSSVATLVDTGSAGPGNFDGFRAQIIDRCPVRILAYLHVSIAGVFSFSKEVMVSESEDIRLMSPRETVRVAKENPDVIVGIKIRLGRHASGRRTKEFKGAGGGAVGDAFKRCADCNRLTAGLDLTDELKAAEAAHDNR